MDSFLIYQKIISEVYLLIEIEIFNIEILQYRIIEILKYQSISIDMQCIGVWSFWAQENNEMVSSVEDNKKKS